MAEFRHPAVIQEQISRVVKLRHEVEGAMNVVGREDPRAAKLLMELTLLAGVLMALEWSACTRTDLDADCKRLIEGLP